MKILIFFNLFLVFYLISCSDQCISKTESHKLDLGEVYLTDSVVYLEDGLRTLAYIPNDDDQIYVQALDSEGFIGDPTCCTCGLDDESTHPDEPYIEWVGGHYFYIIYQVSDLDGENTDGIAGQLLLAHADADVELIGDRLNISKAWKNGDELISKDHGRLSWCEDTEQLVVSFNGDNSIGVQMIDLGDFSTTPTLIGEVFEVKNSDEEAYTYTQDGGISCDGPNEKVFVVADCDHESIDKHEIFGFLYDVSDFDGTYTQIGSDLNILSEDESSASEPSTLLLEDQIYAVVFDSNHENQTNSVYLQAVDGSSDSKVSSIGDLVLVHEDQDVDTYHFNSLATLGESTFLIPYCTYMDTKKVAGTKTASNKALTSSTNLKEEGFDHCFYRVYELNDEKDGLIALTDENTVTEKVTLPLSMGCFRDTNKISYFLFTTDDETIYLDEFQIYWRIEEPTANKIDQEVVLETDFELDLSDAFTPAQKGTLSYKLTLEDGSDLPDWMKFDSSKSILSGTTPDEKGEETILIVATEDIGTECEDLFPTNEQTFKFTVIEDDKSGSSLMKICSLLMFLVLFIVF
ncbi:dystroglycan-related [Anaeramoeba flamelloides]|uniref:Dystroglycan-related n=1 Tax=Anaeramoeba flamelloides TaxID=1746091 RepID=A0ABQ8YBQ7_9EUKA|nr:dystroglycan-related [Anaeramoeba flamelloides]